MASSSTWVVPLVEAADCDEGMIGGKTAIEILNATKSDEAEDHLIKATDDTDWWVRERAIDALSKIGSSKALPKLEEMTLEELGQFAAQIAACNHDWHPIITNHCCDSLTESIEKRNLHPLQRIALIRPIADIKRQETYEYDAEDRDAVLDIPYMT